MADARERLLATIPVDATAKKRHEGANQGKLCLRFVPVPANRQFNGGRWLSLPYPHLGLVDGTLDFTEVRAEFGDRRVILRGQNLKPLADRIEGGTLGDVVQMDTIHAARASAVAPPSRITLTVTATQLPAVLKALEAVPGLAAPVIEPFDTFPGSTEAMVTGLSVEKIREHEDA